MALSLHHHLLYARISPKTVSQVRKLDTDHTIASFPITKPNRHCEAATSVFLGHNHNRLRRYATPTFTLMQQDENDQFYAKVKEAQRLLRSTSDPVQSLVMVDAIQRLGIDGYFQDQIESILRRHHSTHSSSYDDPHHVSLRFRLLRQHGFHVSADVFDKFKDGGEHLNKGLKHDVKGQMGLFEASQLSCEGEDSLEEVGNLSKKILSEKLAHHEFDQYQARFVRNRLAYPFHTSLPRFVAKDFLNESQATHGQEWSNIFKGLHTSDSIKVKSLHQSEIMQVSKWWKELGLGEEMKLARNEPVEWYMWAMGMVTDPNMSALRVELTKPISLIYVFDDIFDVYGTLDELALFTDVIERWDVGALEQLPEYMRICFKALDDTTNEISYKIYKEHGWNPVESLRLTWGSLCKAYLVEARWFGSGKVPKAEEYLKNGMVTSGVHVALVHLFFLLGQNVTHQSAQLVSNTPSPSLVSSTATILRLWDDLASVENGDREREEGSYLKYYMKEHQGVTTEDAKALVVDEISKAWKELNGACISPSPFSKTYKDGCLNLARMCPLMYNYDENHQLPILKAHMMSLLS